MHLTVTASDARRPNRAGATLMEVMMVLTLLGLVGGVLFKALGTQQSLHRRIINQTRTWSQVRQGAGQLAADLRPASPSGGDIYPGWSSQRIEIRSYTASAALCSVDAAAGAIFVPPDDSLSRGNVLTSWITAPVPGDSVMIFDDGPTVAFTDDTWRFYRIVTASRVVGGCPSSQGYLTAADSVAGRSPWRFTLSAPVSPTIIRGAPMRTFRRVRYELYKDSDSKWYVGYYDCATLSGNSLSCETRRPIAGPYDVGGNASDGMEFVYLDSTGVNTLSSGTTGATARIRQIQIKFRSTNVNSGTGRDVTGGDSLTMRIGLRNR